MPHTPVVLCILDGVGWGRRDETDAVFVADTPRLDLLLATEPHCFLQAHGRAVGLPSDADMGNSEVGHNAMGAGRVVDQGAALVDAAIATGAIFESEAWADLMKCPTVHFIGLVSDGNVHSHVKHLRALIQRAAAAGKAVRVHALTDGRDVSERSALDWIEPLEAELAALPNAAIASGGGRMRITMDRYEADWDMVERGWNAHVHGIGRPFLSASEAIRTLYDEDPKTNDQWLAPFVIHTARGVPVGRIRDGDGVVFFNFRGDRALEITRAFIGDVPFDRYHVPKVTFAGMMQYDGDTNTPPRFLVNPPAIDRTVGELLAKAGVRTYAVSETQKFGHVTYFFNGNRSGRISEELEVYEEVPSDNVPFDQAPKMKCAEIMQKAIGALKSGKFDHIRMNLANGDMVGHTGNFPATVQAMEAVDACLGTLVDACREAGAILLVTADHGNADEMYELDKKGKPVEIMGIRKPRTSHSLNPVPFILVDPTGTWTLTCPPAKEGGLPGLAQVGGTLLTMFGVDLPADYLPPLVKK
ncbi:MAG: 2,3-bisphosphoglycerate-independent phosphoglycerate mutase [Myxococcota bacterium]